ALPAGLSLDALTGVISGTPLAAVAAATYTVTASNAAGFATTGLSITVTPRLQPPSGLTYSQPNAVYPTAQPITPNTPSASGGAITAYSVAPALPQGLSLDSTTGVISGTPVLETRATLYTVTGSNARGSTTATLTLQVVIPVPPPSDLAYAQPFAVYTAGQAITPNLPTNAGGPITDYTVSPALPAGLSLNMGTGAISGTPPTTQEAALYTVTGRGVSGSYVRVSRLNHARRFHVLMQLPNGKVLTAGGENATAALASAELYDPATAKWTMTGSMNVARSGGTSTAVQLNDGRVLVTGGRADVTGDLFGATIASVTSAQALKSAEIYDPASGTWS